MPSWLTRDRIAILAALAAPLAVAAVLLPFRASWSNTNVALLLVVVVVGVAATGSRAAGGVAAVWAAIWFDFFFTVPYYRFTIRSSADVTTAVLLLLTGVAVSQLAARARRLKVVTVTDAGYLGQILEPDRTVRVGHSRWDVDLSGLPAEEIELRVVGNGQYHGRFMLMAKPGARPSLQARLVAVTLADMAGRAFGAGQGARSAS